MNVSQVSQILMRIIGVAIIAILLIILNRKHTIEDVAGVYVYNQTKNSHDTLFLLESGKYIHHVFNKSGLQLLNYTGEWSITPKDQLRLSSFYLNMDEGPYDFVFSESRIKNSQGTEYRHFVFDDIAIDEDVHFYYVKQK
jgi:hypothetical protein